MKKQIIILKLLAGAIFVFFPAIYIQGSPKWCAEIVSPNLIIRQIFVPKQQGASCGSCAAIYSGIIATTDNPEDCYAKCRSRETQQKIARHHAQCGDWIPDGTLVNWNGGHLAPIANTGNKKINRATISWRTDDLKSPEDILKVPELGYFSIQKSPISLLTLLYNNRPTPYERTDTVYLIRVSEYGGHYITGGFVPHSNKQHEFRYIDSITGTNNTIHQYKQRIINFSNALQINDLSNNIQNVNSEASYWARTFCKICDIKPETMQYIDDWENAVLTDKNKHLWYLSYSRMSPNNFMIMFDPSMLPKTLPSRDLTYLAQKLKEAKNLLDFIDNHPRPTEAASPPQIISYENIQNMTLPKNVQHEDVFIVKIDGKKIVVRIERRGRHLALICIPQDPDYRFYFEKLQAKLLRVTNTLTSSSDE